MRKTIISLILSLTLLISNAFAFDLEKAKVDYKGADFHVASIKEVLYENAPAIAVSFTVPVDREKLQDHHVALVGGTSDHFITSEDRTRVIFPFVIPETNYTVRVSNAVRDINGNKLDFPQSKKIKTKALSPSVSFTSSAHIISSSSPKHLPVTTLNVNEVTIDFFRIDRKKIPAMVGKLGRNGRDGYYQVDQLHNLGKLVHTGRFTLNPRKNQRTDYNIDLTKIKALKAPGAYVAVMTKAGRYEYDYEHAFFMQTDIGLHVRRYEKSFDVYTHDIATGKPLANVRVDIINKDGEVTDSGESDEQGRVSFHIKSGQHHILATLRDQLSALPLNRNALDLSGLKNAVSIHSQYQIYPWGPRELYRPGEKIQVNMLVRDFDGELPASLPLAYALYKPDGSKAVSGQLQPEITGFYSFSHQLDPSGQTGTYSLKLNFAGSSSTRHEIKVEEFLPERLDLDLFDGRADVPRIFEAPGEIKVPVRSSYLYGAPASGNRVDGFATASVDPHPFEKLPTFFFGDKKERMEYKRVDIKEIKLDENGLGTLKLPNSWSAMKSPVRLRVNASVYESGGRPVTRSTRLTLLGNGRFIGVEPQFKGKPDADATVDFKIGYADRNGAWQSAKGLQVNLVRQDRNWYWRHTSSRGWHWAWNESPVTVFSKSISIKEGETTKISLPLSWGNYRVEVSDGTAKTAYDFQTSWSWWGNAGTGSSRKPDQVSLGFSKNTYLPGETAKLRINPPQDGLALITVESSEKVYFTSYKRVESKGTLVEIPTEPSWNRHDLYTSVMVIRPGDMKETPVPSRSFGMVHLPLKRQGTRLAVEIDAPEDVQPNRSVKAKIHVSSQTKEIPKNTRVVVALVDAGILNITRFKTPDAESYFFGPRRYTIDLFDNYGQIIDNLGPKTAFQRFGGGFTESDAELARGGDKPKSDVRMVSFFSGPLEVDEKGNVTAVFDLPDFNGQLRWMVMAFSDNRFGDTDAETRVADKVVTQLAMPRFLAMGDKSTLALDLQNMSGAPRELSLEITTSGALANSSETRKLSLKDKEKTTLKFPISAEKSSGQGEITMHLTGPGEREEDIIDQARTWRLGVRSPYPSVTRKITGAVTAGSIWKPALQTDDLIPGTVRFQMNLSNRPPIDFAGHFEYLLHYPYGCLEQSISSGYPWVLASPDLLAEMGLSKRVKEQFGNEYDLAFRMEQVEKGIRRVLDRQKSNGSFGLWSSDSPEGKWLTVYAAEFLHDAVKAGAEIGHDQLKSVDKRLHRYLKGGSGTSENRWSEDPDHYIFAYRSYAGYVLAKNGTVRLSDLRRLASEYFGKTADDGLSWMYLASAFKMAGDAKNADLAYKKALRERSRTGNRYYGEYGSMVRDLSLITELSIKHGFKNNSQLMLELADAVKDRRWLSTQERIALFRTAIATSGPGSRPWSANLITDSGTQGIERNTPFNSLFDLPMFQGLEGIEAKGSTVYAAVSLTGERKNAPGQESREMTITRGFYDLDGNPKPINIMKSGELAVVQLNISTTRRTPDGLVVDLLPAGVEIENQNLGLSSIRIDEIRIDGKTIGELRDKEAVVHEEFRDDRFVSAISVDKNRPVTLFYLIRAVTPGVYRMPGSYAEDMYRPYRHAVGSTFETLTVTE